MLTVHPPASTPRPNPNSPCLEASQGLVDEQSQRTALPHSTPQGLLPHCCNGLSFSKTDQGHRYCASSASTLCTNCSGMAPTGQAGCPVNSSTMLRPKAYKSELAFALVPLNCSGAMYCRVPWMVRSSSHWCHRRPSQSQNQAAWWCRLHRQRDCWA